MQGRLRFLPAAVSLGVFALALVALHRLAGEFHLNDVLRTFTEIPGSAFATAVLCAAGSYFALTQYERLAIRHVGVSLPYHRVALTSFIAYAIGHNVGMSAFSGGAIRFRMYSAAGLSATQILQTIAFCTLTFALGAATLTGVSLIADAGRAASLLHASEWAATAAGAVLLLAVAGWVAFASTRDAPIEFRGIELPLPGFRLSLAQIGVASLDLMLSAATLWSLLPESANVSFWAFAGLFMVAVGAGVISAVPGGLGVFESVFVLLLPGVPAQQLLGVLLAYRLVYYALPFALAVLGLSAHELLARRDAVTRALSRSGGALRYVAPQAMAFLGFGAGLVLLFSGSTPALRERLQLLHGAVPLPILELSHLAGSVIGVALLILARGLYRRLDGAWWVSLWLILAGIVVSLLKGLDWEEAALLGTVLLALLVTRDEFHRRASLLAEPLSPSWVLSVLVALGASLSIGLLAYREVPYRTEMWWQFAFDANAPRMLRAWLFATLVPGVWGLLRLLGPARATPGNEPAVDPAQLTAALSHANESQANLALLGDKRFLWSSSGRGFIMYGVAGASWIAMGDPVAPAEERSELIWRFRELADRQGALAAFYEICARHLPDYIDAGFGLSKLGEEARVPLAEFSLEGGANAALRQAHRRAQRDGLSFRVAPREEFATLDPRLSEISSQWLASRSAAEKGFSLGRYDTAYLGHFPIALVLHDGHPIAFANLWQDGPGEELSVDLMRHVADAPRSTMDFLFIELMLWGRSKGFRWFALGMAPLAGLESRRLAPMWHRFGRLVYRFGDNFYNFDGLRAYKDKFHPVWTPRYLAAPGGLGLARVLIDATRLISGGLSKTVRR